MVVLSALRRRPAVSSPPIRPRFRKRRGRAQLGLPLLLVARRLFRRQGAQPPRCHPDHGGFHLLNPRDRFGTLAPPGLFKLLERLGVKAAQLAFEPDAGIWEYRGRSRVHTHSAAMCWAGCNRLGAIAADLGMDERAAHWSSIATAMQARLLDQAWNEKRGAFAAAIGIDDLDASVLLLPEIGLLETRDPRFVRSVEAIERELLS